MVAHNINDQQNKLSIGNNNLNLQGGGINATILQIALQNSNHELVMRLFQRASMLNNNNFSLATIYTNSNNSNQSGEPFDKYQMTSNPWLFKKLDSIQNWFCSFF